MLPLEHSAILLTYIKPLLVFKTNLWSFLKWLFYTGFTLYAILLLFHPIIISLKWLSVSLNPRFMFHLELSQCNHHISHPETIIHVLPFLGDGLLQSVGYNGHIRTLNLKQRKYVNLLKSPVSFRYG